MVTIADRGLGLPGEDPPHLFKPFYRIDAARARITGGVGLGIPTVENLLRRFGGALVFEAR